MVHLAGGLHVIAVAVLEDKTDFPSWHAQSLSTIWPLVLTVAEACRLVFIMHLSTVVLLLTPTGLHTPFCKKTPSSNSAQSLHPITI